MMLSLLPSRSYTDAANLSQPIAIQNIFITGHSLGGLEAEWAALNIPGLTGETFAAPGLPGYTSDPSTPALIDYIDRGDPLANFASDTPAGQLYGLTNIAHVGSVMPIGPTSNGLELMVASAVKTAFPYFKSFVLPVIAYDLQYHFISNYANDLGVTLPDPPPSDVPVDILEHLDESPRAIWTFRSREYDV